MICVCHLGVIFWWRGAEARQDGLGGCSCHNETNVRQKTADFSPDFCDFPSFPDVRGGGGRGRYSKTPLEWATRCSHCEGGQKQGQNGEAGWCLR